jgi:hypothetical protein
MRAYRLLNTSTYFLFLFLFSKSLAKAYWSPFFFVCYCTYIKKEQKFCCFLFFSMDFFKDTFKEEGWYRESQWKRRPIWRFGRWSKMDGTNTEKS